MKNIFQKKLLKQALTVFAIVIVAVGSAFVYQSLAAITSVTVTSPNGSEVWGGTQNITWTTEGTGDTVNLYYCAGANCATNTYTAIATSETNDGTYSWDTSALADAADYKVKVRTTSDPDVGDVSDASFTLAQASMPTYTVTATSVQGGGDTIVLTFNEAMAPATLTNATGITSITGSTSGALALANDAGVWSGGDTVFTITLDEATDGDHLVNGETLTVVLATTVTDVGGASVTTAGVADAAVNGDLATPTFTASRTAVNSFTLTFNESVNATIDTDAWTVAGANVVVNSAAVVSNTTMVLTTTDLTSTSGTPTITYIAATGDVTDLAGNEMANGATADATDNVAPTFVSAAATSNTNIQITFSEVVTVTTGDGSDFSSTGADFSATAAAVNGGDATKVDIMVDALGDTAFTSSDLDIAVNAVRDTSAATNGITAVADRSVTDGQAPTFTSASATSDTNIRIVMSETMVGGTVTFGAAAQWTATGLTSSGVAINGANIDLTVDSLANTAFTAADFAFGAAGGSLIQDAAGNSVVAFNAKAITDGQAPVVNITSPIAGTSVKGTATVSFTDSEITAAQCSIDNAAWVACTTGVTTLTDITGFAGLGEGAFTLYLKDTDAATNVGTDSEVGVIKDSVAPSAPVINALTSPTNDTTPTITGTGETGATVVVTSSVDGALAVTDVVAGGTWSITPLVALTEVSHSLTAVQTDAAGNASDASGAQVVVVDATAPAKPVIDSVAGDASTPGISNTENTPDVVISNVTVGDTVRVYDTDGVTVRGTGVAADVTITITTDALTEAVHTLIVKSTDPAGNLSLASDPFVYTYDATPPSASTVGTFTATSGTAVASYINNTNTGFTLTFTSPTDNFAGTAHLYAGGADLATPVTFTVVAGDTEYTLTGNAQSITDLGDDGAKALTVVIVDTAGNVGVASAAANVTLDTSAPAQPVIASVGGDDATPGISSDATPDVVINNLTSGDTVNIFDTDGLTVVGTVVADAVTETITTDALTEAAHTLTVKSIDVAGNSSVASVAFVYTYDNTLPTIAVTLDDSALKVGDTATVTFTFSEAPTSFDATDVTVGGGAIGAVSATGNPLVFEATLTPTDLTEDATNVITVGTSWTDSAGNAPASSTDSDNYTVDTVRPTVAVTMSDYALKIADTAVITTTFSEAPSNFTVDDITAPNGALSEFTVTGNPLVYTVTFTPTAGTTDLTNVVTIGTAWSDAATNAPLATSDSTNYTIDLVAPTVTLTHAHGDLFVRDADSDTITATFVDAGGLTGTPMITIGAAVVGAEMSSTAEPLVWTYVWNVPAASDGAQAISVSAVDTVGNVNAAATGVTSMTIDNTVPVVSAGADAGEKTAAFTHVDPTATDTDGSGIATYAWSKVSGLGTITFSSAATLDPGNVSASAYDNYTARLTVTDVAGNSATDDFTFSWLPATGLVVTAYSPASNATGVAIANGTASVTFNSNVTLLDATKVTLVDNATGVSKKGVVVVSGGDGTSAILNIPYTGLAGSTTYRINIAQSAVRDASGNTNSSSVSYFTTAAAQGNGELGVTSITSRETYAAVAGGWPDGVSSTADGWSWTYNITVPTTETNFMMKFANWLSGSNTIAVANNMRFYSAQAAVAVDTANAVSITAANTNSAAMLLSGDLDANTAGRQIQVTVEARIPAGSTAGAYSTQYGVTTEVPE